MKDYGAFQFGGKNGIDNICRRIARANRKGLDLTKNWYELFLQVEDAPTKGKNYIPDIKLLEEIGEDKNNSSNIQNNKKSENVSNYLMITGMEKIKYENKDVFKIKTINTESKPTDLIILPEANQEILKIKPKSIIEPKSISKRNKTLILNEYKIIKVA